MLVFSIAYLVGVLILFIMVVIDLINSSLSKEDDDEIVKAFDKLRFVQVWFKSMGLSTGMAYLCRYISKRYRPARWLIK